MSHANDQDETLVAFPSGVATLPRVMPREPGTAWIAEIRQVMSVPISKQGGADEGETFAGAPHLPPPPPPSPPAAHPPELCIDRFVIIRPIGAGGMGEVFLARHPVTELE